MVVAFWEGCDGPCPFPFASFPKGGRGCRDLPAHLDAGRKHKRVRSVRPRSGPSSAHTAPVLWFLSSVLPAVGEQRAGPLSSYRQKAFVTPQP